MTRSSDLLVRCCLSLLALPAVALGDARFVLEGGDWARPRSGDMVTALPAVRQAVRAWSQAPSAALELRHPRGERGLLWAEELRDWLVALGVPGAAVELTPASDLEDALHLAPRRLPPGGED